MSIYSISQNPLIVAIVSIIFGSIVTIIYTNLANKTKKILYTLAINKIGISTSDDIFGNVSVTWQGNQLRNLYFANIEIENTSSNDLENIILTIFTDSETIFLSEKAGFINSTYIIKWTDDYKNSLSVASGNELTQKQSYIYNTSREYSLKFLNRYQKAYFTILCTRPNDDILPSLYLDTPSPGISIKNSLILPSNGTILKVPNQIAVLWGLVICCGFCFLLINLTDNKMILVIISLIIGLTTALWGAILYKICKWVKRSLSK